MATYRIYSLDSDGHIGLADWIQAQSDEGAIFATRELYPHAKRCEVWLKERLAATLNEAGHLDLGLT